MKKFFTIIAALMCTATMNAANPYDNSDTLVEIGRAHV